MPNAFNFRASPFDGLDADEQQLVRNGVDIAYFREGEVILDIGMQPTHLFVVIKGFVQQLDGNEPVASYGPEDTFDGRSLIAGKVSSRFVAIEEVVAYQLARAVVNELIARNANFGALLFSDLSKKLSAIADSQSRHELQSLTLARVDQASVRPPHFVDADTDVLSVVRLLQTWRSTNVLVRDAPEADAGPARLGIFTVNALQRAVLLGTPLDQLAVRDVSNFNLVKVQANDPVGDALTVMVQHKVHRVVVTDEHDNEKIVGVLEALDLFSFLSNHSYLISREISEAVDLEALQQASEHITRLVRLLHRGGTRVAQIASLVQVLNAKLFERAWQMIAPASLVANSCLYVMGSEGRGEQLLKTDQDNGLLLRDGYAPPPDLDALCMRFSETLTTFGYPECPGAIMLSNPKWRGSASEFGERACGWLLRPDGEALMALATFLDAHAVAGDGALLAQVRARVFALANDNDAMLARFASTIDAFAEQSGWLNRLWTRGEEKREPIDPKKLGLFPLVHGVRSMALRARCSESSTAARLDVLVARGDLDRARATDLLESLSFFMNLRLKEGLAELDAGHRVSGMIDPTRLSSLERDLLKDTLDVVKRFRELVRARFRLDAL